MKVSIIGKNTKVAEFLSPVEIVKDSSKADIVIFGDNFSYRSATTQLNKLTKKQLIVTFNSGMDFFKDKYECDLCTIVPMHIDQTVPVLCTNGHIYEGLLNLNCACIPRKNYQRICEIDWSNNVEIVGKVINTSYFTKTGRIPVVSYILSDKYPTLMLIQIDVVRFPKFDISKYINEIICAFVNSH